MNDGCRRTTVYRMRRKLGDVVESRYGIGYRLTEEGRMRIEGVLGVAHA